MMSAVKTVQPINYMYVIVRAEITNETVVIFLRIVSFLACANQDMDARGKFGEHRREVKSINNSSYAHLITIA